MGSIFGRQSVMLYGKKHNNFVSKKILGNTVVTGMIYLKYSHDQFYQIINKKDEKNLFGMVSHTNHLVCVSLLLYINKLNGLNAANFCLAWK